MRKALWAVCILFLFLFLFDAARAQADDLLVGYPAVGEFTISGSTSPVTAYQPIGSFNGETLSGGIEFTLTGSYDVSDIVVSLTTVDSATFSWSLQNSLLGSPTVYASGAVPVTGTTDNTFNTTSFALPVDVVLGPGTYYLVGNSNAVGTDFFPTFGWQSSDGTEVSNGGTAPNGTWAGTATTGPETWTFYSSTASGCDTATPCDFLNTFTNGGSVSPDYAVYGVPVPEPSSVLFLGLGLFALGAFRKLRGEQAA